MGMDKNRKNEQLFQESIKVKTEVIDSGIIESLVSMGLLSVKEIGITVFGFLGLGGGKVLGLCDEAFNVPSQDTGRIQEAHITAGHALMEYIEDKLLEVGYLNLQGQP